MVGRKVTKEEAELKGLAIGEEHSISQEIFHESGENFGQGIVKDEGVARHLLR